MNTVTIETEKLEESVISEPIGDLDERTIYVLADVLDEAYELLNRFVAFPDEHSAVAVTLWAAHTHMSEKFQFSPRLALLSAEKRSGKTLVLELVEHLSRNPVRTGSITSAAIVRLIDAEQQKVTLLIDEIDTVFTGSQSQEALRGVINDGYRAGASSILCQPTKHDGHVVVRFSSFAPVALAGIDNNAMPDTIMDRSVHIRMKRIAPDVQRERFRYKHVPLFEAVAVKLGEIGAQFTVPADIDISDIANNRAADVWETLVCIADHGGPAWSKRGREAALQFTAEQIEAPSLGTRLLFAIRAVFETTELSKISSEELIKTLLQDETQGWGHLGEYYKPLDARILALILKPYGIVPIATKYGTHTLRGYSKAVFEEAWSLYLPLIGEQLEGATDATTATDDW